MFANANPSQEQLVGVLRPFGPVEHNLLGELSVMFGATSTKGFAKVDGLSCQNVTESVTQQVSKLHRLRGRKKLSLQESSDAHPKNF